ncbi:hypothetical protein CB0101_06815 [Synechococcus sp. CB0101]|uniref:hypothetical protein n=1 Tax=Synechococcus sp. CB0101 TaxID=232348 RepID=UPI0002001BED|nr:hypothetical protein [Synechococcus sp. CB0101]QCH14669.1 hypothetical protein CB0101_06815 [Synechococcus sp. CB0101]
MSRSQLRPVLLQLERQSGSLRSQIEAALAAHGTPLRWAITAVQQRADHPALLQIEAVVLSAGDRQQDEA